MLQLLSFEQLLQQKNTVNLTTHQQAVCDEQHSLREGAGQLATRQRVLVLQGPEER
jgi:hypothetical protein